MGSRWLRTIAALALLAHDAGAQGSVTGTVFDSLTGRGRLGGATVVLTELARSAATDDRGRFRFDTVPDGRWTLSFMHDALDSLDVTAPRVTVDVRGPRSIAVQLATPSARTVLTQLCGVARDSSTGVLIGRVRDVGTAAGVAGARVTARWAEIVVAKKAVARGPKTASTATNALGAFVLCGAPLDAESDLTVALNGRSAGPVTFLFEHLVEHRLFTLARSDSSRVTLSGHVTLGGGRAAANALVHVKGTELEVRTDSSGRYRLMNVVTGTRELEVRRVGSTPVQLALDVPVRDTTVDVVLSMNAQPLPAVAIRAERNLLGREGFDARRTSRPGYFVTADQISRGNAWDLSDLVARAPTVSSKMVNGRRMITFKSSALRSPVGLYDNGSLQTGCSPRLFLNGELFLAPPGLEWQLLMDRVRPEDVYGMEVYPAPGLGYSPPEFKDVHRCAAVVVWTK